MPGQQGGLDSLLWARPADKRPTASGSEIRGRSLQALHHCGKHCRNCTRNVFLQINTPFLEICCDFEGKLHIQLCVLSIIRYHGNCAIIISHYRCDCAKTSIPIILKYRNIDIFYIDYYRIILSMIDYLYIDIIDSLSILSIPSIIGITAVISHIIAYYRILVRVCDNRRTSLIVSRISILLRKLAA